MCHQVVLETQQGRRVLAGEPDDTVATVLLNAGVPLSAVWTYVSGNEDASERRTLRFVRSSTRLGDVDGVVRARANRNVDLVGLSRIAPRTAQDAPHATTEWTFPGAGGGA